LRGRLVVGATLTTMRTWVGWPVLQNWMIFTEAPRVVLALAAAAVFSRASLSRSGIASKVDLAEIEHVVDHLDVLADQLEGARLALDLAFRQGEGLQFFPGCSGSGRSWS